MERPILKLIKCIRIVVVEFLYFVLIDLVIYLLCVSAWFWFKGFMYGPYEQHI